MQCAPCKCYCLNIDAHLSVSCPSSFLICYLQYKYLLLRCPFLCLISLTEATYEVLPRLCQIRFDHGVIDEYLFLDMPNEFRLPNGLMLLEHTKVVQKCVYEHQHVTHEGHLRIIFTPELKVSCLLQQFAHVSAIFVTCPCYM